MYEILFDVPFPESKSEPKSPTDTYVQIFLILRKTWAIHVMYLYTVVCKLLYISQHLRTALTVSERLGKSLENSHLHNYCEIYSQHAVRCELQCILVIVLYISLFVSAWERLPNVDWE